MLLVASSPPKPDARRRDRPSAVARSCGKPTFAGAKAPSWLTLVQLEDRIEVPVSADFDHIVFAGQRMWKRYVRLLALHDLSYRVIDLRHPAGEFKSHRLHGTVASNGDRHQWI